MYQPSPFHSVMPIAESRISHESDRNGMASLIRWAFSSHVLIRPSSASSHCQLRPTTTLEASTGV